MDPKSGKRRRRVGRGWILLAVVVVAVAVGHGPALSWLATWAAAKFLPPTGISATFDRIEIAAFQPIRISGLEIRTVGLPDSETDIQADRVELRFLSIFQIWRDRTRWVEGLEIENLRGTLDAREGGMPTPPPLPDLTDEEQARAAKAALAILPETVWFTAGAFRVLTAGAEFKLSGIELTLSETEAGRLEIGDLSVLANGFARTFAERKAITAWKDGVLYLSDLDLIDGLMLRGLALDLAVPGGIAITSDLEVFKGSVRIDSQIQFLEGEVFIDGAVAIFDLELEPLPGLLEIEADAAGVIRDARVSFRGAADRLIDSSGSLRLQANGLAWDERSLDSVVVGANYVGRRLQVAQFELLQGENEVSLNGEMTIPANLSEIGDAPFLLNVTANVRDIPSLAALAVGPIDGLRGRCSVHGSLSGESGNVSGYLEAEASRVGFGELPDASAKLFAVAENGEIQIQHAAVQCGDDVLQAELVAAMASPHQYAGEARAKIEDIGRYLAVLGKDALPGPVTGAVELNWTGDGTLSAHSGFFGCDVKNLVTEFTPAGLTSRISGTYSPQNIYLGTFELETGGVDLGAQITFSELGFNIDNLGVVKGELKLLSGDAFFPLNLFALAAGKSFDEAVDLERPLYVKISSDELAVSDLMQLVGQEALLNGRVKLDIDAKGKLPELVANLEFRVRDLAGRTEEVPLPETSIDIDLAVADGLANLGGEIRTRGLDPFRLSGNVPLAFWDDANGGIQYLDMAAPVTVRLDFPNTNLELLRMFIPDARRLFGTVSGYLALGGTIETPKFDGRIELQGGNIEISTNTPPITGLNALVMLTPEEARLVNLKGEVGAGPFEASGRVDLKNLDAPTWTFSLRGDQILLMRNPMVRLRADVAIDAGGSLERAAIKGEILLVDGRVYKQLEITPFLAPSPLDGPLFEAPRLAGMVPPPFGNWTLDISIENASPFLLVGNLATGEIAPDLRLAGTLGDPILTGRVLLSNLRAFLPATTLRIPEGKIDFVADQPFMPVLDIRATTQTSGYDIQMLAYGTLDDPQLALRSDPPMSQENLIAFMTTGVAPVGMSGPGLGNIAVGQGSILLLRSFARQLEPLGLDVGSVVDRLSVSVTPGETTRESDSLSADFRLTDRFSLTAGEDGYGFFNSGVQYTIRFR